MIKIGITCRDETSIWSNGLDQNIYFFLIMFRKMGYFVNLVSEIPSAKKLLDEPIVFITTKNILNYDIIIEVACPISNDLVDLYNSKGRPLVSIKLGNNFFIDIETMLFKPDDPSRTGTLLPYKNREIWVSPHYFKFKDYIEAVSKTDVKECPYVWDSIILDMQKERPNYKVERDVLKKIAIVEPNLNITKTSITPLIICDLAYKKNKELVKEVYCFNSKKFQDKKSFLEFINLLSIHNDGISSYENRLSINEMFYKNLCGTIVSHQMFNELNYVYFEAIYYNRLLIHNSPYFKDAGYYYNEHDSVEGSYQLEKGIVDYYTDEQIRKSKEYLEIYSINNKDNIARFKSLIEGVL